MFFSDRADAGARLGAELAARPDRPADPLVLALPRGGVPVGDAVARRLGAPLDVFVVRKIGAPAHPEYAIGAIAEGGTWRLDAEAAAVVGATPEEVNAVVNRERAELDRRVEVYRRGRKLPPLGDKTVVVVDDGLATGLTAEVACRALRRAGAACIVLAAPVGSPSTVRRLRAAEGVADEVVCLSQPPAFHAVGQFYSDFSQTTDDEVIAILEEHAPSRRPQARQPPPDQTQPLAPARGAPLAAAPRPAADCSPAAMAAAAPCKLLKAPQIAREPGAAAPAGASEGARIAPGGPEGAGGGHRSPGLELLRGAAGPGGAGWVPEGTGTDTESTQGLLPEAGPEPDYRSPAVGCLGSQTASLAAAVASGNSAWRAEAGRPPHGGSSDAVPGGRGADQRARRGGGGGGGGAKATAPPAGKAVPAGRPGRGPGAAPPPPALHVLPPRQQEVTVRIPPEGPRDEALLPGTLTVPAGATGIVLFAHGSGSGRLSPRNRLVAAALNEAGVGTLLFDLLTEGESRNRRNVFDMPLLAARLEGALGWLQREVLAPSASPAGGALPVGFFGASTGGAAALWAAAELGGRMAAVVSRGGRPDLASDRLPLVTAPTLLLVGGDDHRVLALNEAAARRLTGAAEVRVGVVPGATHLFEEPGALEAVGAEAARWFARHFAAPPPPPPRGAG